MNRVDREGYNLFHRFGRKHIWKALKTKRGRMKLQKYFLKDTLKRTDKEG